MTAIVESIEIARRPDEVFAYATNFAHYPAWQASVVSVRAEENGPLHVGSRAEITRKVGPRQVAGTEELTALQPPRSWEVCAVSDTVSGTAKGVIEPLAGGERSRLTISLDFEGHGLGRLLVPLVVRRQARKQLSRNQQKLKEMLERQTFAQTSLSD